MAMTKSLKESFITLLSNLDKSGVDAQAEKEIADAIRTLKNNKIVINDTGHNKEQLAEFILDMFNRFPGLYNKNNQALLERESFSPTITPRPNLRARH